MNPTDEQLAEWALAAISNARRLYSDAEFLFDSHRTASAMVLLGLAVDEMGKHMMIIALPTRENSDGERKKFERRVRSHVEKVGNPLLLDWILDPDAFGDAPDPVEFHSLRNAAIYADFTADGVTVPEEHVDRPRVASHLGAMGRVLRHCEAIARNADKDMLAEAMKHVRITRQSADGHTTLWRRANLLASINGVPESEAARFATIVEAAVSE